VHISWRLDFLDGLACAEPPFVSPLPPVLLSSGLAGGFIQILDGTLAKVVLGHCTVGAMSYRCWRSQCARCVEWQRKAGKVSPLLRDSHVSRDSASIGRSGSA